MFRQEVSNSNSFDALDPVENDDDLCTNGGILKSAGKGSLTVASGSSSTTPITERIDKLERKILDGKLMSSYARAMIELRAVEELKNTTMVAMPKLIGYEWGNSSSSGKGVSSSSISVTPLAERIDKFKRQIIEGKLLLVDDYGKPLSKVDSPVNADRDSEVEEVFDEV
ncbi:hypothetical protein Tco_1532182 [Tanacetum coccineum]